MLVHLRPRKYNINGNGNAVYITFWWRMTSNHMTKNGRITHSQKYFLYSKNKNMMFQSCYLKRLNKDERWWFIRCHFTCMGRLNNLNTASFIVIQNYWHYIILESDWHGIWPSELSNCFIIDDISCVTGGCSACSFGNEKVVMVWWRFDWHVFSWWADVKVDSSLEGN